MNLNTPSLSLLLLGAALSFAVGAQTGGTPDSGSTTGIGHSPGSDAHSDTERGVSDLRGTEMAKLDEDKDGKVSESEAKADATWSKKFKKMDANSDGMVDAAELAALDSMNAGKATGTSRSKGGKDDLPTPSY